MSEYGTQAPARYRRRRGGWVTLLVVLVVLAGLVVLGDRVAANVAARELRTKVVGELQARDIGYQTLDVGIGGFPFLTQVVKGTYQKITIDLTQVVLPPSSTGTRANVTLPSLNVIADGVNAKAADLAQGTAKVTATDVSGTATISFATMESLIDFGQYNLSDVQFGNQNGAFAMSGKVTAAGVTVPIAATAQIVVAGGQFRVTLKDASAVAVQMPALVRNYLSDLATKNITAQLPPLPFGLSLQQVVVQPDGLAISAAGHNVPLVS